MIIYLISLVLSINVYANPALRWMNALKIVDKHEFYKNNQLVDKPKETWQTLFAVVYADLSGSLKKDCLYYRIPGESLGIVKIKTVGRLSSCDDTIFDESPETQEEVKSLQFSINEENLSVTIIFNGYKEEKWDIPLMNHYKKSAPIIGTSSAEVRSGAIVYLAAQTPPKKTIPQSFLKNNSLCHAISDDCQELSSSICGDCQGGWYEIPNGCAVGPKFCGYQECGQKHQPACRRGMHWQRKDKEHDCRRDNSFAYCSKGYSVQCEGSLAKCL